MEAFVNEARRRLEIALAPQKPPTLEEVLAEIGRRGVLSGSLDRVVEGYRVYIGHITDNLKRLLGESEDGQLSQFANTLSEILKIAASKAHNELTNVKEEAEDLKEVEFEGHKTFYLPLRGISTTAYFPDLLRMGSEVELLQMGWRASDEGDSNGRPFIHTSQLWQLYAWLATRPGDVQLGILRINLTNRGVSPIFFAVSKSWRQRWSKEEAIRGVLESYKNGELKPLLTWWLGDGSVKWSFVEKRHYKLRIAIKNEYKEVVSALTNAYFEKKKGYVYIPGGKKLFKALINSAGPYGKLIDVLHAHKWLYLHSVNRPRRSSHKSFKSPNVNSLINIGGIEMRLTVVYNEGGALYAIKEVKDYNEAVQIANKLKELGISPRITATRRGYSVYIPTKELKILINKDVSIRRNVEAFLENKIRYVPMKQQNIIRKLKQRLI
ncbi:hypothetical protein PAE2811 [Pyrobaculum aerophilum str. IM2]|uniref:Uncharacterized protein n=2 Tax=Pyrobaculum aerophilum TaxID=13773 RepID=Q8ZUF4_PYRAE|nr:hypothetical protein [Pyrobaculum aerophilum]AAL64453.1 hypothetical protein PAE2811 [Pyrobaculum aerophilum str. IM2]HII47308.1 hypothetical protein [Pyrobaculum aerophilum]